MICIVIYVCIKSLSDIIVKRIGFEVGGKEIILPLYFTHSGENPALHTELNLSLGSWPTTHQNRHIITGFPIGNIQ